jgi:hypothetical protein
MTASYTYLAILAVHLAALALFGGMVLATDLRLLGLGMRSYSAEELIDGLRVPKRVGFALATVSGAVLFTLHPEQNLHNAWFWSKLALVLALGVNYWLFGRGLRSPKLAGGLSLLLWTGVVCAGRGPATIKDVMHSMIDPSGDYVFESVKLIGDEHGSHQEAPHTQAEWDDLRRRLAILQEAPSLLATRQAARPRDRSRNPQSESQPEQVEAALDADRPSLVRRARKLQTAATRALQAVDAKDTKALLESIDSIDKACENCHLHYWYPNDRRAQQAAKEDGVTDY